MQHSLRNARSLVAPLARAVAVTLCVLLTGNPLLFAAVDLPEAPQPALNLLSDQTFQQSSSNPMELPPAPILELPPPPETQRHPATIATARTVFIANLGSQTGFRYSGNLAYDDFIENLKAWGRFDIVDNPADADLILQLYSGPIVGRCPQLQLTVVDPATQVAMYSASAPIYYSLRNKDKTDWLAVATENLTTELKQLTRTPITKQESDALTEHPKVNYAPFLIVTGVTVTAFALTAVLMKEHFDNTVADQKAALCKMNAFFCN